MPVITFEKISPADRSPVAPAAKKPRGFVVAMLDRFVEAKVRREEKRATERTKPKA